MAGRLRHNPWAYWNYATATFVLAEPWRVFRGIRDDGSGSQRVGLCYTGNPENVYDELGVPHPRAPGWTFAVFVDQTGYMLDWYYLREQLPDSALPIGCEVRFTGEIWRASHLPPEA